jgi:hypothetical protein
MVGAPAGAWSQEHDQEALAKQLANPVAALISVPLQGNYDREIGPAEDGQRFTLNIQPVIPIGLTEDWNLISRTILPTTYQDDIFPGAGDQFGLGDTLQSLFLTSECVRMARLPFQSGPSHGPEPRRASDSRKPSIHRHKREVGGGSINGIRRVVALSREFDISAIAAAS